MASEVFCRACADTGVLPSGTYAGAEEHYAGEEECPECPLCPCGDAFSKHSIQPAQLVRAHGEFWAPECLTDFHEEMEGSTHGTV